MHGGCAARFTIVSALLALTAGCGAPARPEAAQAEAKPAEAAAPEPQATAAPQQSPPLPIKPPEIVADGDQRAENDRSPPPDDAPARPAIDEARVEAQGIRKLSGERLTLYTDLPLDDEIKSLPDAFEQAYPQWREYFGLSKAAETPWHAVGRLMQDEAKFRAAGLLPDELPQFLHGYSRGDDFWIREQPSDYYRRHLLLHEGTHSFMFAHFGTCGPPWYMEGMAELLATHSWIEGQLKLNVFPASRDDVPYWGRIKIVRDAVAAHKAYSLEEVFNFEPGLHSTVEPYGWCWATAAFLDGHPRYQERFRRLPAELKAADFNARVKELYSEDWPELNEEWQCYTAELDYGYDLVRTAIDFVAGEPLPASGSRATVAADRGWQSTGIRLEANKKYLLRASGRYQLGQQPQIWWCEPNGVSLRYFGGRPLGILMAAIHPDPCDPAAASSLLSPTVIGLGAELTPTESGTLYLRINDSPAELADNVGEAEVEIVAK